MKRGHVGSRCLGILLLAMAASAGMPVPEAETNFLGVALPAGEVPFLPFPDYPTARLWRYQHTNDVAVHTTRRGVGPDSAFVIFTRKGEASGEILAYDVGVHDARLTAYKGLCFWMRGDGGEGNLSIGSNWNQSLRVYPRLGKFPLSRTAWTKYFVPWSHFTPDVSTQGFWFLNFKLEPAQPRQAWAVLARVALYKDEVGEAIQPCDLPDPPGLISASDFVHPDVAGAARLLPRTLAKLHDRQPVTIVAAGDSITCGAQMNYRNPSPRMRESDALIYFALLQERLARHYGYTRHRAFLTMWQTVDKKSGRTAAGATEDGFAVMGGEGTTPAEVAAAGGLQVIGVGAGGMRSPFGFEHLDAVTRYKPDLVIWAYGANDIPANRRQDYEAFGAQAIRTLQAQGIEVLVCRPTFFAEEPYFGYSAGFGESTRALAAACNVPWVDQFGAFTARGRRYVGDLLADSVHPNEYGHEILAATLAAALGVPGQRIWEQPYFTLPVTATGRP